MAIISDWIITHDGVTFPAGKVIFDLPKELQQKYISEGVAKEVPVVEPVAGPASGPPAGNLQKGGSSGEGDVIGGSITDPNDDIALTPDEFAALKAPEQSKELEAVGIEPASNKEDRIAQYTEWYNQPEPGDDEL